MKNLILILICGFLALEVSAQNISQQLEIGKPMPDFYLKGVQYYKKKNVTLKDFKGQWLILDFWNKYCSSCVESHPRMDTLRKNFIKKNVEVILVGYNGSQYRKTSDDKGIRELFERNRKLNKLSIPIVYDSVFMEKHGIKPTPYIIIISPEGDIKAITIHITNEKLDRLIKGDTVSLRKAYGGGEREKWKKDDMEGKTYILYNSTAVFHRGLFQRIVDLPIINRQKRKPEVRKLA